MFANVQFSESGSLCWVARQATNGQTGTFWGKKKKKIPSPYLKSLLIFMWWHLFLVFFNLFILTVMVLFYSVCLSGRRVGGCDETALSGDISGVCLQAAGDTGEKEVWVCWACECMTLHPDGHSTWFISTWFAFMFVFQQHLIWFHMPQKRKETHLMKYTLNAVKQLYSSILHDQMIKILWNKTELKMKNKNHFNYKMKTGH